MNECMVKTSLPFNDMVDMVQVVDTVTILNYLPIYTRRIWYTWNHRDVEHRTHMMVQSHRERLEGRRCDDGRRG
jgi:hypothetical protein